MNGIFIRRFILMTVFVILSISTAMPQGRVVQNGAALALDDYFTRAEAHGFSGTVLCAKGSKIFFQKAFGTVDRTNFLPNKMSTVFNISSLDKPMIAEAILKLHEQGKLDINSPISRIFNYTAKDKAGVTLLQIMSHTSGLDNVYWDAYLNFRVLNLFTNF